MIDYNKYINYLFIAFAFVLPISRAGIVLFSMLLIFAWLIEGNLKQKYSQIKSSHILIVLSVFIFYNILSLIWSENIIEGLNYIKKYWYFIVIFVFYTSLKQKSIKYILYAFLLGMFISELLSYGLYFEWWTLHRGSVELPSPFMHHLQYSTFLAFTTFLLINMFLREKSMFLKWIFFALFFLTTINLFFNAGRTGQVAFVITLFVVGFLNIKNRVKAFFLTSIVILTIVSIGYSMGENFKQRVDFAMYDLNQIVEKQNYCNSFGLRVGAWTIADDIIIDNPVIGVGASDSMRVLHSYIDKSYPNRECVKDMAHFHNDLIQLLVQLGILGAILYILLFYKIARINISSGLLHNMPIIFVFVYVISGMFENLMHQQFSLLLFTLFVGLFVANERIENEV
jgi:O-antigen ligase